MSHMLAFAGIEMLENLFLLKWFHEHSALSQQTYPQRQGWLIVGGFVIFILLQIFAVPLRMCVVNRMDISKPQLYTRLSASTIQVKEQLPFTPPPESANQPLWLEELDVSEQHAFALVLGFLTLQTLISWIEQPHGVSMHSLRQHHQILDVFWMFDFAILFLIVLITTRKYGTSNWWLPNFRIYLAMSMAWCLVRAEEGLMKIFWEDGWMARIWSA